MEDVTLGLVAGKPRRIRRYRRLLGYVFSGVERLDFCSGVVGRIIDLYRRKTRVSGWLIKGSLHSERR